MTSRTILTSIILFFCLQNAEGKSPIPFPIFYPSETISNNRPYIIWQDLYNKRDKKVNVRYRITMNSDDNKLKPIIFYPETFYRSYYVFRYPINLTSNKYSYTIERLLDNKSSDIRHFHFLKYPVQNEFTIDSEEKNEIDSLPPEYLIKYLFMEKNNMYNNGYNVIFFGSGAIATFGIGILFYSVLDFGIASTIISVISFTSSAVGISATGYYGYKYIDKKSEMQKILEIGKGISVNGNVSNENISADIELTF